MIPTATIDRSTTDHTETTEDEHVVARIAALRATSLRTWAETMDGESLSPLSRALHQRAGELELIAAVLADEPSTPPVSTRIA